MLKMFALKSNELSALSIFIYFFAKTMAFVWPSELILAFQEQETKGYSISIQSINVSV